VLDRLSTPVSPPAADPPAPPPLEALPRGATIGRYFILRKLGEGGMGAVYAAYDPELDRKIALKVLSPERRASRIAVSQARLLREAQAMARISHPNVVAVHDVGAHGDEVFVAMELVEGGTLTDWVEAKPRKLDEILRTFVEAGKGLAAAHRAGLVHRDFKPENVLVGADGRVRVTDFGLARVDELPASSPEASSRSSPSLTQDGAIVGTPLFMSPEQAQGRVSDARSDQYGFCSSLHWAIYGQAPPSPFLSLDTDATSTTTTAPTSPPGRPRGAINAPALALPREPKLPSSVRRALLRGLSWDAAGRFPSMDELLSELLPSRRQVTQRRALLAAAAMGVVAAAAVTARVTRRPAELCTGAERRVSGVWGDAERKAVASSFTDADPVGGRQAADRTVAILDRYTRGWAATYADACEATRLRGEQTEAVLSRRMICLDRRLHQVEVLANLFRSADDKLVQKSVDAALGLPPLSGCDAASLSTKAVPPSDPQVRAELDAINRQVDEARALSSAGRHKDALRLSEKAARDAERLGYWPARSEALLAQGTALHASGDNKGAEPVLRQAMIAADIAGADLDKVTAMAKLIHVEGCQLGAFSEGQFLAEAARPLLANLGNSGTELEVDLQTGTMLQCQGHAEEALEVYQRGLEVAHRREDAREGVILSNMADAYTSLGRSEDALRMLRQALRILSDSYGPEHPELAYVHYNMSEALRRLGDNKGAYDSIQEAIRIRSAALGPGHPLVADALDRLALSLLEDGLYAEALVECQRSLAIREKALGPDHPDLSYSLENLGAALIGVRQPAKAIPALERAIALRTKAGAAPGDLAEPRFSLARALWDTRRERGQARALAAHARDGYLQAGQKEEAEKVSAWLAAH
jgi:eukaryotic-like serine/threonine-protein kinase